MVTACGATVRAKEPSISKNACLTNLKNLLNFRLSLSSWGPIKVGARGNLLPPAPRLGAALARIYEYAHPPFRSSTALYLIKELNWIP
jgi:hypothetical protein